MNQKWNPVTAVGHFSHIFPAECGGRAQLCRSDLHCFAPLRWFVTLRGSACGSVCLRSPFCTLTPPSPAAQYPAPIYSSLLPPSPPQRVLMLHRYQMSRNPVLLCFRRGCSTTFCGVLLSNVYQLLVRLLSPLCVRKLVLLLLVIFSPSLCPLLNTFGLFGSELVYQAHPSLEYLVERLSWPKEFTLFGKLWKIK